MTAAVNAVDSRRLLAPITPTILASMNRIALIVLVTCSCAPAYAVTIPTVLVGDPGNVGDVRQQGIFGSVAYSYRIGATEVTVADYCEFLNAVARTDTYGLYNSEMTTDPNTGAILRGGSPGDYQYIPIPGAELRPVAYVSWGDAARFANWLHNGQPTGMQDATTTEDGAYTLNGANTDDALLAVSRNSGATWFIPSEDEWYKAAYYQPFSNGGDTDSYWRYPTQTNVDPYSDQPPGSDAPDVTNTANYRNNDTRPNGYNDGFAVNGIDTYGQVNYLTNVGAYDQASSYYGTFDQAGNLSEWNEAVIETSRGMRGGYWSSQQLSLRSSFRGSPNPTTRTHYTGFRVATVPEPSGIALAVVALAGLVAATNWRRARTSPR